MWVVTVPLASDVLYAAYQTPDSFSANRDAERGLETPASYRIHVDRGNLPAAEVKRMNAVAVANAHQHVYGPDNTPMIRRFLSTRFVDVESSVRKGF